MIDPMISLAFSIHSNKGVYALLLGSGVSRSADIPTGWEVVLYLIRRIAASEKADCEPDPETWYTNQFGEAPDYSKLLEKLVMSPAERSQFLRSRFEPKEEEREEGKKLPTLGHKAIAELVASGYIRVIITTNFDRLLEQALEAVGIHPTVISTLDAINGAMPLIHTKCTIVKVHGDYLDTRIKNTPSELEQYDDALNQLLDRVFDEFGLIVCGWSAEWDAALRSAMVRCPSRRFTTYWTVRGQLGKAAEQLVQHRRGEVVKISDSDSFFQELTEKVSALEEYDRPHPLSAKIAIATLKKYLPEDRYRIRLHDLVNQETEKLFSSLSNQHFPQETPFSKEEFYRRIEHYNSLTEVLLNLIVTGCYWGDRSHEDLWVKSIERIANSRKPACGNSQETWYKLKLYPSALLFYAGGIAAIAKGNYTTFVSLMNNKPTVRGFRKNEAALLALETNQVIHTSIEEIISTSHRVDGSQSFFKSIYTPLSDLIFDPVREPLREFLPDDVDYESCFDRFEYLFALANSDLDLKSGGIRGFLGRFAWSQKYEDLPEEIGLEIENAGADFILLKLGLFDGSLERLKSVKATYDSAVWKRLA